MKSEIKANEVYSSTAGGLVIFISVNPPYENDTTFITVAHIDTEYSYSEFTAATTESCSCSLQLIHNGNTVCDALLKNSDANYLNSSDEICHISISQKCPNHSVLNNWILHTNIKGNRGYESVQAVIHKKLAEYSSICDMTFEVKHVEYLMKCLKESKLLRGKFYKYCYTVEREQHTAHHKKQELAVLIELICTRPWLDYGWNYRMIYLVLRKIQLDDAMNWLNTLGGGYSALGDHFSHHAEKAGEISFSQLRVAIEMGDPPTVIRCRLYFALSLMQRGYLRESKYMLRKQYEVAKKYSKIDHRLMNMCKGLWSRLSYYYSQRKKYSYTV